MQEGELVTRLQQVDCHLPLQERILGGYFSRGYGGMPNATKSMASAVCICNSGLDCLWAWLLNAMCWVPPMFVSLGCSDSQDIVWLGL